MMMPVVLKVHNDILNQVWDLCKYSIKATTFNGLYVDGDRERIPYEADAYLNQLSHYTTDREYAIGKTNHRVFYGKSYMAYRMATACGITDLCRLYVHW